MLTLTVDSGHTFQATYIKLVAIYSGFIAKSAWTDLAFDKIVLLKWVFCSGNVPQALPILTVALCSSKFTLQSLRTKFEKIGLVRNQFTPVYVNNTPECCCPRKSAGEIPHVHESFTVNSEHYRTIITDFFGVNCMMRMTCVSSGTALRAIPRRPR